MAASTSTSVKRLQFGVLLTFLWVGGLFASLLWSPVFVADAIEQSRLAELGVDTQGKVASHGRGRRRNADYFWATIEYEVNSEKLSIPIQGDGAAVDRLPLGAVVKVRYLPNKPRVSRVKVEGASSNSGPGWTGLLVLWGLTLFGALGAYIESRRKRSSRKAVMPNPAFQRTTYGDR